MPAWLRCQTQPARCRSASEHLLDVAPCSTYCYKVRGRNACGESEFSEDAQCATDCAPSITGQPVSQAVCEADPVTFSVTAEGTPDPTFQWHQDGAIITGATSPTYTITSVSFNDAGEYDVEVTNACGSTLSDPALLTVEDCAECEGDVNGDGTVDPLDSGFVLARFGCPVGTGDPDCDAADMNGDGLVDPLDVGFVLARFGTCS